MNYGGNGIRQKKKLLNSSATKFKTKFGIFFVKLLLVCAVAVIIGGSCLVFGAAQGIIQSAPDISSINISPEGFATKIYDNDGNEIQTLAKTGANRIYVSIDQIPIELQHAFVAIEDERFYQHNGIDLQGIMRAAMITVSDGEMSQGASTITQQLLKNNVFNAYNESTMEKIKRKVQEQYLAIKLETVMSKDSILEDYLNTINLGNGYYGVQAAANGYFNKDVSELTLSECAVLASITKNPSRLNPLRNPDDNKDRQLAVLNNMLKQEYITSEEYSEAIEDDVYARLEGIDVSATASSSNYSYFIDEVIEQLINDLMQQKGYSKQQATNMIYSGGLSVYTTQDMDMQEAADTILNDPDYYPYGSNFTINYNLTVKEADGSFSYYSQNNMEKWYKDNVSDSFSLTLNNEDTAQEYIDRYRDAMTADGGTVTYEKSYFVIQPQISFSIMEQSTGYVKVLVGGRGDKNTDRGLNRATNDVARQPGSSIKPLVAYGPALDTGAITLATAIDDAPYYYSGSDARLVKNYTEGEYLGYITVRAALTRSQNVPAVKVLTQITPAVGFSYLQKFGLSTLVSPQNAVNGNHDIVQSLALGGMTKGASNIDMTAAYAAIANKGVYTKPIYYTKVLDSDGNILIDNSIPETHKVLKESSAWLLTSGLESVVSSGTATRAKVSNQPTAGKTGTTQFDTDIWFCGFTPYYTASIWVGYDDNSRQVSSVNHTSIWRAIMEKVHSGLPSGEFTKPDDIVEVAVCSKSGKLPVEGLCDADPRGSCVITEYFSVDNQPTEPCDTHVKVNICNDSGDVANVGCTNVTTKILTKKPASDSIGSNESGYTTRDAEYSITEDKLTKLCSLHQTKASTPSASTSNNSSGSNNNNNKNNGTTNNTSSSSSANNSSNNNNSNSNSNNNSTNNSSSATKPNTTTQEAASEKQDE